MNKAFKLIKANKFFPEYASQVNNWRHKLRGFDGNKKPIEFSDADKRSIIKGLRKLIADIEK